MSDMTKDQWNEAFEAITEDLDDDMMALNALNDVLDEMMKDAYFGGEETEFPYRDGVIELGEAEAYKLTAMLAARFGWGGNILIANDVRKRIEALTQTKMPKPAVGSVHGLLQEAEFFDGKGLELLVELQEAFICRELGLLNERQLGMIVEQAIESAKKVVEASKLLPMSPFNLSRDELIVKVCEDQGIDVSDYDLDDQKDVGRLILRLAETAGWSDEEVAEVRRRIEGGA